MTRSLRTPSVLEERLRRRQLVILFSDLSQSTLLAASMDAEEYAELLGSLRLTFLQVITQRQGTIVQIQGDGVLAIFGYPRASEDDGRQAVEAALDIHRQVQSLDGFSRDRRLTMHSGIHAGRVLLEEGDSVRGRFGLLGDAPNIASKLCDLAQADQILVSSDTLRSDVNFFRFESAGRIGIDGRSASLPCVNVHDRIDGASRFETRHNVSLTSFVGRTDQLEFLHDRLRRLTRGEPQHVAVIGPPGVGKTRLVREFVGGAAQTGCHVWSSWCDSHLGSRPLQPLIQILRSFCSIDASMSIAAARVAFEEAFASLPLEDGHRLALRFVMALGPETTESQHPFTELKDLLPAFRAFFKAVAVLKPQILVIDDWQWADAATHRVLVMLVEQRIPSLFVLVASREQAAHDLSLEAAAIVRLEPLDAEQTERAVSQLRPGLDPFHAQEIWKRSGGNPLFIEELCHAIASSKTASAMLGVDGTSGWLASFIESRVERLPAVQAEAVRTAAIIGNVVPIWLLEALIGRNWSDAALAGLEREDLIYPDDDAGTLRFKHGIAREIIYGSVGLRQRREVHRQIADALRGQHGTRTEDDIYEVLAYHFGASGDDAQAARFSELAGDKALAASALDRAQLQYEAALSALERLAPFAPHRDRWLSIAQRYGLVCVFDPAPSQLKLLRRAIEIASVDAPLPLVARAHYWFGYVSYAIGDAKVAMQHLHASLAGARQLGDVALVAQLESTLGQSMASACDYENALHFLRPVKPAAHQKERSPSRAIGLAYMLACRGSVLGDQGAFPEAHQCFEEAIDVLGGVEHEVKSSVLCWRSAVCAWQRRWSDARRFASEAERIAVRVRSLYLYARSVALQSYADWMTSGSVEDARRVEEASGWLEAREQQLFISLNHGWLAECCFAAGDHKGTRRHAGRALSRARKGDRLGEAMVCRVMARVAASGHRARDAEHYLSLAERSATARRSSHEMAATLMCRAEIETLNGRQASAREHLDRCEAMYAQLDMAAPPLGSHLNS